MASTEILQTIYDRVAGHFLRMQGPAVNSELCECRYRTEDGRRCFVGALIPDECYDPKIEGKGFVLSSMSRARETLDPVLLNSFFHERIPVESLDDDIVRLLAQLQEIHDNWRYDFGETAPFNAARGEWYITKELLIDLAVSENLSSRVLDGAHYPED